MESSFNRLPNELKLLIFTYVSFQTSFQCSQLNRSARSLITSNYHLMRRFERWTPKFHLKIEESKITLSVGKLSDCLICIIFEERYVNFGTPALSFTSFFGTQAMQMQKIENSENMAYSHTKMVKSLLDGMETYLWIILRQLEFKTVTMVGLNSSRNSAPFTLVFSLMEKFKCRPSSLKVKNIECTTSFVNNMSSLGSRKVCLVNCSFVDGVSPISDTVKSLRIIDYSNPFSTQKPYDTSLLHSVLGPWMNGSHRMLKQIQYKISAHNVLTFLDSMEKIFGVVPRIGADNRINEMTCGTCDKRKILSFESAAPRRLYMREFIFQIKSLP